MRIFIHDYGRYPYPWQLAKALAKRGHTVRYGYSASDPERTKLHITTDERDRLDAVGIRHTLSADKHNLLKRRAHEKEHGVKLTAEVLTFAPDIVISANSPLDAQRILLRAVKSRNIPFVFWLQDVLSVAIDSILKKKIPLLGALVGQYYVNMERTMLRQSDSVIMITEDFRPLLHSWGVANEKLEVVENWAPLAELPALPPDETWLTQYGLSGCRCLFYAGTMGMKHNPELLVRLAERFRGETQIRIVVASVGVGAEWLKEAKDRLQLDNLVFIPFQPFDVLPRALASAAVLIAVLEPDAGVFSVPSKVLTYLCARRPLLLSVPGDNLAARIVSQNKAGLVVEPQDTEGFVRAAAKLLEDDVLRQKLGTNARCYAESHFEIESITDSVEGILIRCLK
jgi:glycosyltransferase involved in cell wall biosynthesis